MMIHNQQKQRHSPMRFAESSNLHAGKYLVLLQGYGEGRGVKFRLDCEKVNGEKGHPWRGHYVNVKRKIKIR